MSSDCDSESEAGSQLRQALRSVALSSFDFRRDRPSLKHLNADSSWLLSLPYPSSEAPAGRCRFNIVIDPWLKGPQVDLFSRFSSQEHATASAFQTLQEVSDRLKEAETSALQESADRGSGDDGDGATRHELPNSSCFIDAVCCSHEFTDHCHEATLRELPPDVPVFAPKKAAALVRSWKHFNTVLEIPVLEPGFDWRTTITSGLPQWIGLGRIHSRGDAPIYFHSALAIMFSSQGEQKTEAVVYTPHGAMAESMEVLNMAKPNVSVLALLHGLHDISLAGAQLNMGMKNAVKAQQLLSAKYWFPTHDEVKVAHGLVSLLLKRVEHTFAVAPGSHPITEADDRPDFSSAITDQTSFHELVNGESLVLM